MTFSTNGKPLTCLWSMVIHVVGRIQLLEDFREVRVLLEHHLPGSWKVMALLVWTFWYSKNLTIHDSHFLARLLSGFFWTVCKNFMRPTDCLKLKPFKHFLNKELKLFSYVAKSWNGPRSCVPASPVDNPKISRNWQFTVEKDDNKISDRNVAWYGTLL